MNNLPPSRIEELTQEEIKHILAQKFHYPMQKPILSLNKNQAASFQNFEPPSELKKILESITICKIHSKSRTYLNDLTSLFTDLALYAYDNDIDRFKTDNFQYTSMIEYLNFEYPLNLREAIFVFLVNAFQSETTFIMDQFIDYGIISTLYQSLSLKPNILNFPILRCLTSIAAHDNADKVLQSFSLESIEIYFLKIEDRQCRKQIIRLLHAIILSLDMQDADINKIFNIFKLNQNEFKKQIFEAMIDLAAKEHSANIMISDEIFLNDLINRICESSDLLGIKLLYAMVLNATVKFSFQIERFLDIENESISILVYQTLCNAILNSTDIQNEAASRPCVDKIQARYQDPKTNLKLKKEIIIFIGSLIRSLTSEKIYLLKSSEFFEFLVESLDFDDKEVIINSLCAISQYSAAFTINDAQSIRERFIELNGHDKIEALENHLDSDIRQYVSAFTVMFLEAEERTPFNFVE